MRKSIFILLLLTSVAFSQKKQKVEVYNRGHNGMEFVARYKDETVIISTFNSKMTIRQDIARKIYNLYVDNKLTNDTTITVDGNEACVTGKCVIRIKDNLILVDFYYETVEWLSGLKEIYKNKLG